MVKKKSKSSRADGKGGWVAGKHRNEDVGDWHCIRIGVEAMINDHFAYKVRTYAALGKSLGVSDRTVRRWVAGEDRPSPETQEALRQWLTEQREAVGVVAKTPGGKRRG